MKQDQMPLYPDEDQIAREIMGPKRAKEWAAKARYLEDKEGLPRIDPLMGGRFWPAVVQYFRLRHGIELSEPRGDAASIRPTSRIRIVPFKPDGQENFDAAKASSDNGRWGGRRGAGRGARL